MGEQRLACKSCGDDGGYRRKEQHAPSAKREKDEEPEPHEYADKTHSVRRLSAMCQGPAKTFGRCRRHGAQEGAGYRQASSRSMQSNTLLSIELGRNR